jgi:hypothetical protein
VPNRAGRGRHRGRHPAARRDPRRSVRHRHARVEWR